MENINLNFYLEPPELTATGTIVIEALAPLSMVSAQPGAYFRSELKPPVPMVYGVLENALGWHFHLALRKEILKGLAKRAKKLHRKEEVYKDHPWLDGKPVKSSKTDYFSLLQFHLAIQPADDPEGALTYDDLWSMHLRDRGMNFTGGSRNYDSRLEHLMTTLRTSANTFKKLSTQEAKDRKDEKYELGDRKEFATIPLEETYSATTRRLNPKSYRDGYPMYYVSPKKRGFVVPQSPYRLPFQATPTVKALLIDALTSQVAPTYLGASEGWVAAKIED